MAKRTLTAPAAVLPRVCLIGQRFGMLVVTEFVGRHGNAWQWRCICDCGNTKVATADNLRYGSPDSCGCRSGRKKHGHGNKHPLYESWRKMRHRCSNQKIYLYERYGGRGIAVCDRWQHDFAAFVLDMGPKPSAKHSIDRINNNGDYEPGNCRWATRTQQARNTSYNHLITFMGRSMCVSEAAEIAGLPSASVIKRLRRGWPVDRALTQPLRKTAPPRNRG